MLKTIRALGSMRAIPLPGCGVRHLADAGGSDAPAFFIPRSYVGKRYRCHDPDSANLGEIVEIYAHGCGSKDPLVGRMVTGDTAGSGVVIGRVQFLTHYLGV